MAHGMSGLTLKMGRIRDYLGLGDTPRKGLPCQTNTRRTALQRDRPGCARVAVEYRSLIADGIRKNRVDVAKLFKTSRAWVTKIMKDR